MTGHRLAAVAVIVAALLPLGHVALKGEVPSFRDHEDYFVPLRAFTAEAIRDGEMPLWNPFNGAGEPWLANPQTGVFYPPAWLVAALPFEFGYVAFLSLHLAVLGLGLRQLFRLHGSDAAATLVSVAFVVSGPVLSLLDVSNNLATFAWAPWLLARALRRDSEPGVADTVLLSLCFLGGEPLLAAVTWIAWAVIVLVRLGRAGLWRVAWRIFTAIALSAAQLLPFVELLVGSDRAAGLAPEIAFRNSMAVQDWLATVVTPAGVQPGIGRSQMFLPSIYLSPLIVLLALVAFARNREGRWRSGWLVVLLSSIVLASGGQFPVVGRLLETLLLTVNRYPVKLALFGFVAGGALAVYGFDQLEAISGRARVACALAATVFVIGAQFLHRSAYAPIAVTGALVGMMWLAGFVALLWFGGRLEDETKVLLVWVLLPVVVFESLAASRFLLGSAPWPFAQPYANALDTRSRLIRLEQLDAARTGDAHVRDRGAWIGGYLNLLSRQHDASTAAPVVDRRFQELHDLALSEPRHDILDFLSVRYILTERDLSSFGYPIAAEHLGVAVFERPDARPMATVEFAPRDSASAAEAFDLVTRQSVADRVIATGLENEYPSRSPDDARATVRNLDISLRKVSMDVETSHRGLLVLSHVMREGWIVTVDGALRPVVRANALFRGVEVEPGIHRVVWTYRPRSVRSGIFVSIFAMCALAFEWRRVLAIRKKMSRSFHSEHA